MIGLDIHPVRIAILDDPPRGGAGEMRADHQHRPARQLRQHPLSGALSHFGIAVGG